MDLELGSKGSVHTNINYDHLFNLKHVRYDPGILLRTGIGDFFDPGS
jgi:hypothetical protein